MKIYFDETFIIEVSEAAHHGMNLDDFVITFEVVGSGFVEFF